MKRRAFLKFLSTPFVYFAGLHLFGRKAIGNEELLEDLRGLKIWSYYVPLTSYTGIIETFAGINPLDRKVIYEEVIKKTNRINGKESDGTKNPESFEMNELENAEEYIRVHFWHDDNGIRRPSGHTLYIFKRYLENLKKGEKVFVATGMYQSHFHVVMIQPPV